MLKIAGIRRLFIFYYISDFQTGISG